MTTSVRMDPETERLLDQLARERSSSKSEVVRYAVRQAARRRTGKRRRDVHPFDLFRGIIGSVHGGPTDLSERTGERFRRLLLNRRTNRA